MKTEETGENDRKDTYIYFTFIFNSFQVSCHVVSLLHCCLKTLSLLWFNFIEILQTPYWNDHNACRNAD